MTVNFSNNDDYNDEHNVVNRTKSLQLLTIAVGIIITTILQLTDRTILTPI